MSRKTGEEAEAGATVCHHWQDNIDELNPFLSSIQSLPDIHKPLQGNHKSRAPSAYSYSSVSPRSSTCSTPQEPSDSLSSQRPAITVHEIDDEHDDNGREPFNIGPLISILLLTLVKPICYDIVLPFINRMILELGTITNPEKVGPYSGFLMSMFSTMVILSLLPWSFLSDRFGRKPVILIGSSGMAITIALFGLSTNYGMMVVVMCVSGCLAGTTATLRVLLAESYPLKSHRISALSAQQIAFRIGQMTGDTLGGLLSHPERKTKLFNAAFWTRHPFALPCFVASLFSGAASIYGGISLRETRPRSLRHGTSRSPDSHPDSESSSESQPLLNATSPKPIKYRSTYLSILTPQVVQVLLSIFLMAVSSETLFSLYPLLAFTPPPSGLGIPPSSIGFHMALRSALNIVTMCVAVPVQQWVGSVRTFRWGMACLGGAVGALWAVVTVNVVSGLEEEAGEGLGLVSNSLLLVFLLLWGGGCFVWPSSQVILVESPKSPEDLALVVGISQIVQWIGMAISPIFVNNLYSYSITHPFPIFGRDFVYVVLLTIILLGVWCSFGLEESGDGIGQNRKTDRTEQP